MSRNVRIGIFVGLILALIVAHGMATQYFAHALHYQEALGAPLFHLGATDIYEPFALYFWASDFYDDAPKVFGRAFSIIGIVFGAAIVFVAWLRRQIAPKQLSSCGTAHWADEAVLKESHLLDGHGIFLGKTKDGRYLRDNDNRHAMVISPTRGGKGVGLVTPTGLSWKESAVFIDIKGEIYGLTSGYRKDVLGQTIIKFDPISAEGSACFNPLDEIRLYTADEVKDCINIVHAFARPDGSNQPNHWRDLAASLIEGTVLHLKYVQQGDASFSDVLDYLFGEISVRDRLWEMAHGPQAVTDEQRAFLAQNYGAADGVHPFVKQKAYTFLQKDIREFSGIVSTVEEVLKDFFDPILAKNSRMSSFKIHDLMNADRPVSLYLIVPPSDLGRLAKFFRVIIVLIYQRLTEKMEFADGRPAPTYKHKLLLLLDEFPALGRIEEFEKALGYIAGYGLRAFIIIQGLNQIFAPHMYGKNTSIIDNCHIRVFHTPNDAETPEYVSKLMGKQTIRVQNKSYENDVWQLLGANSFNVQERGRELMTTSEISEMDAEDEIIFVAGKPPIRCKKIRYYKDRNFVSRLREAPETDALYPLDARAARKAEVCKALLEKDAERIALAKDFRTAQESMERIQQEEFIEKSRKKEEELQRKRDAAIDAAIASAVLPSDDDVDDDAVSDAADDAADDDVAAAPAGDPDTTQPDGFDDLTSGDYLSGQADFDIDF